MHFSWPIDGSIVGVYLLATMIAGVAVSKYVGKVEHFLVAGREMDLYLGIPSLVGRDDSTGGRIGYFVPKHPECSGRSPPTPES